MNAQIIYSSSSTVYVGAYIDVEPLGQSGRLLFLKAGAVRDERERHLQLPSARRQPLEHALRRVQRVRAACHHAVHVEHHTELHLQGKHTHSELIFRAHTSRVSIPGIFPIYELAFTNSK